MTEILFLTKIRREVKFDYFGRSGKVKKFRKKKIG